MRCITARTYRINKKEFYLILMGASPQTPGIYRIEDQSMVGQMKVGAAQPDDMYGPHASVTCSALGLLPSIALSSEQVQLTYHT
jgi:hypothetical protein